MLGPIVAFLEEVGLPTRAGPVDEPTVLPGIRVAAGVLVYDEARLLYPGDLLHEAGHLAVLAPEQRAACDGDLGSDGGREMGAIAWSWAALTRLGLDPAVVFHDEGYHGGSAALVAAFSDGRGPGVPILAWRGLTTVEEFPAMQRWTSELPWPG